MSFSYSLSSTSRGRGDDVTPFPPELDDAMLEDRLEQARQNRTNYYRRMLASRTRPLDDPLVSRKSVGSYTSGSGGSPSISDTPGTVPVPNIPQPHCSWRFYTSYDNGEWKRHAVPVDHDVEDILREPTKTPRRERDKVSPPHSHLPSLESSSSIRRARQAGGSLAACLQPRAKRTSESSNDVVATAGSRVVGLQVPGGQVINGLDAQLPGQLGPAELMGLCGGNEELVRQILEGGGLVAAFDGENHPPGKVKQEFSSKYMSTVTVTQPAAGAKNPGVQGEGGATDVAKMESDGAGVPKSRRPRIYGFQEKIIIPTKYKTSAENQENDGVTAVKTDSTGHYTGSKVNQDAGKVNGVVSSGTDDVKTETTRVVVDRSSTLRSSPGRTRTSPESQKVKVVVVNSGSDVESDRRSEERKEAEEEQKKKKKDEGGELAEVVQKEPGTKETFPPFVMQEGLTPMENFQAFQENFRRQFENTSVEKKDGAVEREEQEVEKKGGSSTSSHPGQRLFSKDEQTFSDVGPDGQKRDGKVVHTYEVVTTATTADGDLSPPTGDEGPSSIKEISITPVGAVRSQLTAAAILSPPAERRRYNDGAVVNARGTSPFGGGGDDHRSVKIIRETGSTPALSQKKTVEIVREHRGATGGRSPVAVRRTVAEESSFASPKSEERRGVRTSGGGDVSIFDQTGSLFKQLSPRPRAEREREFASPRDTRQWSRDQGGGGGDGGGGYTGRTAAAATTTATRTWTDGSAEQPQGARRKVVIVREMDTAAGGGATDGGDGEGQRSAISSSSSSKKTVEIVREGVGEPAGHHPSSIVFREPDGRADQSGTRTTVKIVRETGDASGTDRTVKTPWETDSEISSLEGATSFGGRVLFASSKGKENPDRVHLSSSPSSSLSGSATKQSSRIGGDKDTSAEQWEVQVAVKD